MHHNYGFERKQLPYAACDAALAASLFIISLAIENAPTLR